MPFLVQCIWAPTIYSYVYLLGHGAWSQDFISVAECVQLSPPCAEAGLSQIRILLIVSLPQVSRHVPQLCQVDHAPLTKYYRSDEIIVQYLGDSTLCCICTYLDKVEYYNSWSPEGHPYSYVHHTKATDCCKIGVLSSHQDHKSWSMSTKLTKLTNHH